MRAAFPLGKIVLACLRTSKRGKYFPLREVLKSFLFKKNPKTILRRAEKFPTSKRTWINCSLAGLLLLLSVQELVFPRKKVCKPFYLHFALGILFGIEIFIVGKVEGEKSSSYSILFKIEPSGELNRRSPESSFTFNRLDSSWNLLFWKTDFVWEWSIFAPNMFI